jgi:multiple sugar transport system permease protein
MAIRNRLETAFKRRPASDYRDSVFEFLSRKRVMAALTMLPVFLLFLFVNVTPIVWAIAASLHAVPALNPEWTFVGVENYVAVLENNVFYESVWRSIVFAAGSVGLQLAFGVWIALMINRSFRGATLVRAVVMLPYLVPTAVLGFVALWMGNSQFGIINQLLLGAGIIDQSIAWYGSQQWAMISVIITNSWKFSIFVTIMVLARLQGIPDGFYEAASVAGATPYQQFRDITLPNIKGIIFIVLLLRGVWMFNKFDIVFVLTGGGPLSKTRTIPIHAYQVAFNQFRLGQAAAISTILFGMLIVAAIIYFKTLEPSEGVRVE